MKKRDIHVLKYFSSFVSVSHGKVINITDPTLAFCPLAHHLYKDFDGRDGVDKKDIKNAIQKAIESKIKDFGLFTDARKISSADVSIPYGASEMISFALQKKVVDAAVIVCEGAGTVITDNPEFVQGIGARMNSLLMTSPIKGIIKKLKDADCHVIYENALINQIGGVKVAIKAGYKSIAVTVSGNSAGDLKIMRELEKASGVRIVIFVVCTTNISLDKVERTREYADLVWSCASSDIRRVIGPVARCQLSKQIPVFVLTQSGMDIVSTYAKEGELVKNLRATKQYLFSSERGGQCVHLGNFKAFISESHLPVHGRNEPRFMSENNYASV